jgi:hypothetical protein
MEVCNLWIFFYVHCWNLKHNNRASNDNNNNYGTLIFKRCSMISSMESFGSNVVILLFLLFDLTMKLTENRGVITFTFTISSWNYPLKLFKSLVCPNLCKSYCQCFSSVPTCEKVMHKVMVFKLTFENQL